jgi:hypothetical protein
LFTLPHQPPQEGMVGGAQSIGIEREPKYFDIACKRIEDAQRQGDMFIGGVSPCVR